MTRYYDLLVYFKKDKKESFSCLHYPLITENILNVKRAEYEKKYNAGVYAALRIEYTIIQ